VFVLRSILLTGPVINLLYIKDCDITNIFIREIISYMVAKSRFLLFFLLTHLHRYPYRFPTFIWFFLQSAQNRFLLIYFRSGQKLLTLYSRIWGFHNGGYEEYRSGIWRRVVLWAAPACSLVCWTNSSTLKMEAIRSSETSCATQRTTRRHIPEDDTLLNIINRT
jgi:hypothetical protein